MIDRDAVGFAADPVERSWRSRDSLLHAIGVCAGIPSPSRELQFTTENSERIEQRALPTMAATLGAPTPRLWHGLGDYDRTMVVHAGQAITLRAPLPVEGSIRVEGRIAAIYDKGSGALVVTESESTDLASGTPMATATLSIFIRGEGGWGGDPGPPRAVKIPTDREPDHVISYNTRPEQALIYRLSGDRNPVHSDPEVARRAGFARPPLHGLCTYGFTGRALLHALCESEP